MNLLPDSANIWISLFPYWNGGTVANSNFCWLPDYDHAISQIDSNASSFGSVSLVSDDFNNDGKNELALGYCLWKRISTRTVNTSGESDTCLVNWDTDGSTGGASIPATNGLRHRLHQLHHDVS